METTQGTIILRLYEDTPLHCDNFIRLVRQGFYDGVLFHRVIPQFMIQAGDPDSRTAADTLVLGSGDVGYTIPAEFRSGRFHRRGALAAARTPDEVNPDRQSSGCQFYIVTGRKYRESELLNWESQVNNQRLQALKDSMVQANIQQLRALRQKGNAAQLMALQDELEGKAERQYMAEPHFRFSPAQVSAYTTVGGSAHLDGAYTVFGEVEEGMEVVERIGQVPTGVADRPVTDVRILKAVVVE